MKPSFRQILTNLALAAAITAAFLASPGPVKAAVIEVGPVCSLAQAVQAVNTNSLVGGCDARGGVNTIVLQPGVTYTLTGMLTLTKSMSIIGDPFNRSTIDANKTGRVMLINTTGAVNITGVIIKGGEVKSGPLWRGAGIYLEQGSLTLNYVTLENNGKINTGPSGLENTFGGGLLVNTGTSADINYSIIRNNQANSGGGVVNYGRLRIYNSSLLSNTAADDPSSAGALYNNPTVYGWLINTTISGNASGHVAGIFTVGPLILENSTLADNNGPALGWRSSASASVVKNNIIARQQGVAPNCLPIDDDGDGIDNPIALLAGKRNLANDESCLLDYPGGVDVVVANPNLVLASSLSYPDSSSTPMYALVDQPTNPAVGAGENCAVFDQRGRVRAAACDLGSFELRGQIPFTTMLPVITR
jgi:hypothetical protein